MELSDEELLLRYRSAADSKSGEPLLNQLFQRHHRRVAAWCYRLTGDLDASADMAQEIFLKAFQRLGAFRGDCRFTTWLYAIARNHCMDRLRARAAEPHMDLDELPGELPDSRAEEITTVLERRESEDLARRLIRESLDETEVKVMTLHFVEEMPLDSVTRLLGLTNPSGAKAHIVNARRKLAKAFAAWKNRAAGDGGSHVG